MKTLMFVMFAAMAVPVFAQDFSATYPQREADLVLTAPASEGALQAAAAEGNPLQAINPVAPAEYGSGRRFVAYEASDPFVKNRSQPRPVGIRLFAFTW